MMKLLRNHEVASMLAAHLAVIAAAAVSALKFREYAVLIIILSCAAMTCLFIISTKKRYKMINRLSSEVDRILHGDDHLHLDTFSEGELSILSSEIYKMTVCLRQQQNDLKNDKVYLADSIADISHQIRTPLTSVNLLVSMLSEEKVPDSKRLETARKLRELLSRIDWLITALLKMSKLDAGTARFASEEIPLGELIERSCMALRIPIELHDQTLEIKASGNFHGDISWTCEAVGNIVKNCMEHTPPGGKISIYTEENPVFTQILISDTGCGIPKDDLPDIFKRFYKGKDSGDKNFGIGLALARMIITSQNGTIKAGNNPDCGAYFDIRFYSSPV